MQPGGQRATDRLQHRISIVHDLGVREPQHGVASQAQLGVVRKVFDPVYPPDKSAEKVVAWFKSQT